MLNQRLALVQVRITQACQRGGRDPAAMTMVCVTKGVPVATIQEALRLGVMDLGENRVQETRNKQEALGARSKVQGASVQDHRLEPCALNLTPVRWHLIGHLQRNKAKEAATLFDVIHSVDSVRLAEELERQAERQGQELEVFVQVNVSGETTKFGCQPQEAAGLAHRMTELPHLRLQGLMTIAPFTDDPEDARPHFRRLRELRDALQAELFHPASSIQHPALLLSMGMSQDFEVAIEEGADVVRIGTAIFAGQGA